MAHGLITNEDLNYGYTLDHAEPQMGWLGREKMIQTFTAVPEHPVTFILPNGTRIRTCHTFPTDQGSQPPFTMGWLPKDRHVAVYFHDDAYRCGGCWVAAPGELEYRFRTVTRARADLLLWRMLQCGQHPLSLAKANAYWVGVKLGQVGDLFCFWAPPMFRKWASGRAGTVQLYPDTESIDVDPTGGYNV